MLGIKHIVTATDLSEQSGRAFERAAQLGRERGATLALLHVVEPGLVAEVRERRHAFAEEYLRDWFAKLPEADRSGVRFNVEIGEPFAVIIEQARERDADLIVIGEPGKKGLKEFFVGTTTERVVRHSDRPVREEDDAARPVRNRQKSLEPERKNLNVLRARNIGHWRHPLMHIIG